MKKIILTIAIGLFFISFSNAQTATTEKATAEVQLVKESTSCEPGCTKSCCTDKKKATVKDEKSKAVKKSCATKKRGCASKSRPNGCKN